MSRIITVEVHVKNATATLDGKVIATKPLSMTVEEFNKGLKVNYPMCDISVVTVAEEVIENNETVNTDTGEIIKHTFMNRYNSIVDNQASLILRRGLNSSQYSRIRPLTSITNVLSVGTGVATGIIFGKTILTGVTIGVGTYIVSELVMYQPRKLMYNKLLK